MTDLKQSRSKLLCRALLFDMDGTLINSIAAAERIWRKWAIRHGLDVETFLPTMHGARAVDTVAKQKLPGINAEAEAADITRAEIIDVEGVVEIPGAAHFLNSLPLDRWAIVTSAPLALAKRRLKAAGIPLPSVLVTADDVAAGKPSPEGYQLAAQKLGFPTQECMVFEDAVVGIEAGKASGAQVMVVTSTHTHPLATTHPTIANYEGLRATLNPEGFIIIEEKSGSTQALA
jgi:sugar-phosphatase